MTETKSPLYLIGYRGSGKTTTAKHLAVKLGWQWIDADELLEKHFNCSIRSIFDDEGEEAFRDKESQILQLMSQKRNHVIATGGGIILREANRDILRRGFVVWLQAPAETLWRRISTDPTTGERRPNLSSGGLEEVRDMLAQRETLYQQCAELVVSTEAKDSDEIAAEISRRL